MTFEEREKNNFDHPKSFDFDLLIHDLNKLEKNGFSNIPKYNFKKHLRANGKEKIIKKKIIIIEGIFSIFNEIIRNKMTLKVFIDVNDELRLKRRIERDIKTRGRDAESILNQYHKTVRPMYLKYVNPTKNYADLIINNNNSSFNLLCENINKILKKNE